MTAPPTAPTSPPNTGQSPIECYVTIGELATLHQAFGASLDCEGFPATATFTALLSVMTEQEASYLQAAGGANFIVLPCVPPTGRFTPVCHYPSPASYCRSY
jgi:hypothetical protein